MQNENMTTDFSNQLKEQLLNGNGLPDAFGVVREGEKTFFSYDRITMENDRAAGGMWINYHYKGNFICRMLASGAFLQNDYVLSLDGLEGRTEFRLM